MVNPFISKARDLENKAYKLENDLRLRAYDTNKKLSDAYMGVGEEYKKAGFFEKARLNYKDASKRAVSKGDRGAIEKKINKLNAEQSLFKWNLRHKSVKKYFFLTVGSLVIALFFISFNLTGYITGQTTQNNSTWIGAGFFMLGLIFSFFYFRSKK